jgi:hypothetical protein
MGLFNRSLVGPQEETKFHKCAIDSNPTIFFFGNFEPYVPGRIIEN